MLQPLYPSLYQINTRICLTELGEQLGRPATLDDLPDSLLDRIAAQGFDWIWLLGVWQTGVAGQHTSRTHPQWRDGYLKQLPDLTDKDICGSPFAVSAYLPHSDYGGLPALERLRERLQRRNLLLMLDFVGNHTALDHPWVHDHPEYYIHGDENNLLHEPQNYYRVQTRIGPRILAHGRDPYFPGWPDSAQLNYRHAGLRRAMSDTLHEIARLCDGLRCDMAMLTLPEVLARTWGEAAQPIDGSPPVEVSFWPEALARVRREHPGFRFLAEVYWDLEWEMQQQGFDYTYDKRLYDRLRGGEPTSVRLHLLANLEFQRKSVRFLENHDEPRAAATFPWPQHQAAAVITFLVPGLRFFHEGQFEGRTIQASLHLRRRAPEPPNPFVNAFYQRLLGCIYRPEVRSGRWQLCETQPAWTDNPTWQQFVTFCWQTEQGRRLLIVVNYSPNQGQCRLVLPFPGLRGKRIELRDEMRPITYARDGNALGEEGLYLDMPGWCYHVFEVQSLP